LCISSIQNNNDKEKKNLKFCELFDDVEIDVFYEKKLN